jgi:hypothetical protein
VVSDARAKWSELWDLVATQDRGNQDARADVVVGGEVVLPQVPVTTLLFLEKQLNDLETFLSKLPTPDPGEDWDYDANTDQLKTPVTKTTRTKKVPRNHVVSPATDKHPAQVQVYQEDVVVGHWSKTAYTGRVPAKTRNAWVARAKALRDAVKQAREVANMTEVAKAPVAQKIFDHVLVVS